MRPHLILATLGLAIVCSAASAAPAPDQRGARLFQQNCGVCHINGRIGPELTKVFVVDREADARAKIMDGSQSMPGFKYMLDTQEVDLILSYLKGLDTPPKVISVQEKKP